MLYSRVIHSRSPALCFDSLLGKSEACMVIQSSVTSFHFFEFIELAVQLYTQKSSACLVVWYNGMNKDRTLLRKLGCVLNSSFMIKGSNLAEAP